MNIIINILNDILISPINNDQTKVLPFSSNAIGHRKYWKVGSLYVQ
ncbi:MAG: hypothetical protein QOK90_11970 [Nitrososphaeraceae archaeon]|nr:hypothetical protein [Nitrososphaeraceae archaeon]